MANILGKYLIDASNSYKQNKKENESYEEFFSHKYSSSILKHQEAYDLIQDFLLNKVVPSDEEFSDTYIETLIANLHKNLVDIEAIKDDFNTGELLGYILLGNVLNLK